MPIPRQRAKTRSTVKPRIPDPIAAPDRVQRFSKLLYSIIVAKWFKPVKISVVNKGAMMIKRQRKAILLVVLACLVVLVCSAQRMASLHALAMKAPHVTQQSDVEPPVTPCELSAKSLLASPPIMFEGALFALALLMVVLTPQPVRHQRRWPPRVISPPRLRVHLRLCVFRE